MKVILFDRKIINEDSILLKGLMADGKIYTFKIPGILKSKKRSSFYYYPGTLWDFTFNDRNKKIIIPKETNLLKSCFNETATFDELNILNEFLLPLKFFLEENDYHDIYQFLYIEVFKQNTPIITDSLVNRFYIYWINFEGLLDSSVYCAKCSKKISYLDYVSLQSGNLCRECVNLESDHSIIPYQWIIQYNPLKNFIKISDTNKIYIFDSSELRKKIISFFKTI